MLSCLKFIARNVCAYIHRKRFSRNVYPSPPWRCQWLCWSISSMKMSVIMSIHLHYERISHYICPSQPWACQSLCLPISNMNMSIIMSIQSAMSVSVVFIFVHLHHMSSNFDHERINRYVCPSLKNTFIADFS